MTIYYTIGGKRYSANYTRGVCRASKESSCRVDYAVAHRDPMSGANLLGHVEKHEAYGVEGAVNVFRPSWQTRFRAFNAQGRKIDTYRTLKLAVHAVVREAAR